MAGSGSTLRRRILLGSALLGGFFWIFWDSWGLDPALLAEFLFGASLPEFLFGASLLVLACALPAALVGWLLARWRR